MSVLTFVRKNEDKYEINEPARNLLHFRDHLEKCCVTLTWKDGDFLILLDRTVFS